MVITIKIVYDILINTFFFYLLKIIRDFPFKRCSLHLMQNNVNLIIIAGRGMVLTITNVPHRSHKCEDCCSMIIVLLPAHMVPWSVCSQLALSSSSQTNIRIKAMTNIWQFTCCDVCGSSIVTSEENIFISVFVNTSLILSDHVRLLQWRYQHLKWCQHIQGRIHLSI